MHAGSGTNVVFQEQATGCPVVAGWVASHAAYCPRVTSVTSIAKRPGTVTARPMQRTPAESDQHDSCGWQAGQATDVPPAGARPPAPAPPPADSAPLAPVGAPPGAVVPPTPSDPAFAGPPSVADAPPPPCAPSLADEPPLADAPPVPLDRSTSAAPSISVAPAVFCAMAPTGPFLVPQPMSPSSKQMATAIGASANIDHHTFVRERVTVRLIRLISRTTLDRIRGPGGVFGSSLSSYRRSGRGAATAARTPYLVPA